MSMKLICVGKYQKVERSKPSNFQIRLLFYSQHEQKCNSHNQFCIVFVFLFFFTNILLFHHLRLTLVQKYTYYIKNIIQLKNV